MLERNTEQYKVVKGQKGKETGFEVSYEYTSGNEIGKEGKSSKRHPKANR